jgi:HEAT repeat protein
LEAVFILTELRSPGARELLLKIANDAAFSNDEIKQAAVWGLGKAGLKQYADLVAFLGDADRDVVLHAVAAFGDEADGPVIDQLIADLVSGVGQRAPAASEALRVIGSDVALKALIAAARQQNSSIDWILATLGRFDANTGHTPQPMRGPGG